MLRDEIYNIIQEHLSVCLLSDDANGIWIALENTVDGYVPVDYSYYNIMYSNKYFDAVYEDYNDISIVIFRGGTPVCIWPLAYWKKDNEYVIGSNGLELLPPLVLDTKFTVEAKRKLFRRCLHILHAIMLRLCVDSFSCAEVAMNYGCGLWSQYMLEEGAYVRNVNIGCFVDLSMPLDKILYLMRRTNRYSISKAKSLWNYRIITRYDDERVIEKAFEDFRKLHIEVAGRETRAVSTWNIQCEALKHSDDFIILLYDSAQKLIGASLYSTTRSAVTYSVATYKRELFKQPVAHVSQWMAIEYAKSRNKRWYYIGQCPYMGDFHKPTDKELAIGYFKKGFATNYYPILCFEFKKEK